MGLYTKKASQVGRLFQSERVTPYTDFLPTTNDPASIAREMTIMMM
jgi:hypothetical protein